jgi:glycerophosphoryl diester phosphodiesterase
MIKQSLFLLILFSSCSLNQNDMADKNAFDWQGHRGCRGLLPENTIPAFLKAMEYPIKTLELDLAVSKDGILIVSHDPYFSHHICKNPNGKPISEEEEKDHLIYNLTYEQIKAYDCGSQGNKRFPNQHPIYVNKPSLEDMVNSVEAYCFYNERIKPYYNIEIKSQPEWYDTLVPSPAEFVKLVLKETADLGIQKRVCIQSFDPAVMIELNKQAPKVTNAFLVENLDGFEANMAKLDFTPDIYSPYYKFIDVALVTLVHAKKMKLIPWTVNEVEEMKRLKDLGVDGIITDYPDRISLVEE